MSSETPFFPSLSKTKMRFGTIAEFFSSGVRLPSHPNAPSTPPAPLTAAQRGRNRRPVPANSARAPCLAERAHNRSMPIARRSAFALLIGTCILPMRAQAEPEVPTRNEVQWEDRLNKHQMDASDVVEGHREGRILLEISASREVLLTDSGKRVEELYEHMQLVRSTSTEWTDTWSGTASGGGDTMELDLTLDGRKCTHLETWRGEAPKTLPCAQTGPKLKLTCLARQVSLESRRGAAAGVPAWSCSGKDAGDVFRSWVVGRASCLKSSKMIGRSRYEKCDAGRGK